MSKTLRFIAASVLMLVGLTAGYCFITSEEIDIFLLIVCGLCIALSINFFFPNFLKEKSNEQER